ncbi:MAG: sugar transferase [Capsulimonadaceae bacterium]|nr:sugar transferase [Capsulimonadaceae bacterium]
MRSTRVIGPTIDFVRAQPAPVRYAERVALREAVPRYPALAATSRRLDLALSILALALSMPIMALIALAILVESEGPVLVYQVYAGMGGRLFRLYQFRCVRIEESKSGHPTLVGRLLRLVDLDKMPCLLSVVAGNMSLVGPTPVLPDEAARYTHEQASRLAARPGLTGLSQLKGARCASLDEAIALDIEYIKNQSISLYTSILLRAIAGALKGGGC